jgi:hypothetical protein
MRKLLFKLISFLRLLIFVTYSTFVDTYIFTVNTCIFEIREMCLLHGVGIYLLYK